MARGFAAMTPEQRRQALEKAKEARENGTHKIKKTVLTPIKAIRAKCLECSCNQYKEVLECPVKSCPLWPYRMGKRPTTEMRQEYKKALGETDVGETKAEDELDEFEDIELEEDEE